MKIFCTGRSGSLGRQMPESVNGLVTRLERSRAEMEAELATGSAEGGALIHLAALTSPKDCESDPERAFEWNVRAAERWFEAADAQKLRRFVFVSTSHVFEPTLGEDWLTPERPTDARSVYGRSKAAAEARLRELASGRGIELRIARVFSVISREMRPGFLYPALVERARRNDLSPLTGYQNVRDFMPSPDVAASLVRVALETTVPGLVHVCTGRARTVRALAEEVFGEHGIAPAELAPMFPPTGDPANYMISRPTKF